MALEQELKDVREQLARIEKLLVDSFTDHAKPDLGWVNEDVAAAMCGLTPAWFRRMCKSLVPGERIPINYRHRNNRNYQYWLYDIEKYLKDSSTLPKKKRA